MTITFDTNCLIHLEKAEPESAYLDPLVQLCKAERLRIQIPGISLSENPLKGRATGIREFVKRLEAVGLHKCSILRTIGYWDITFVETTVWATQGSLKLERTIHEILFPNIECGYSEYCRSQSGIHSNEQIKRRWLNAKCDVVAMWCHLKNKGDIFVSSDKNFHKESRKGPLLALGANSICTPCEAMNLVGSTIELNQ